MSFRRTIVMLFFVVSSGLFISPVVVAQVTGLPDFTKLVEQEGKAVVNIGTTQTVRQSLVQGFPGLDKNDPFFEFFRPFSSQTQRDIQIPSLGSGFIISSDGYVMTNAHVVAKADKITVTLTDKRQFKAKLIGSDARTDVALLKIDAKNLPIVRIGNPNKLKVGEWVLAIGSPFGFDNSVTAGIISAKGRQLPDENFVPFLQTDAAINPGNSGGPLFNMSGEVVGINSQIYSRSGGFMGISFSIPIDVAMNVANQIKVTGKVKRARIGVAIQYLNKNLASSFGLSNNVEGALVTHVEKDAPAAKAGIKVGDIILSVDGVKVATPADLSRIIGNKPPYHKVVLGIWRNRARINITLRTDELKEVDPHLAARETKQQINPKQQNFSKIGLLLSEVPREHLNKLGVPFGLLVQKSTLVAEQAGVRRGDIIIGLAGNQLKSVAQFTESINHAEHGSSVALQILRGGATIFIALPID